MIAPAKINLTLEVLGRRNDGFHEVATLMQTISLADHISFSDSDDLELQVSGPESAGVPADTSNLALRAAVALREAAATPLPGVCITIEKQIPAAAGLGGGSSDAAAVLRGLNHRWKLGLPPEVLSRIAATLGSDVPFFLYGGAALATGRGEQIRPLEDLPPRPLTLFLSEETIADKTRTLYAALQPADFTDGARTSAAAGSAGTGVLPQVFNAFDRAVADVFPGTAAAMAACRNAGVGVNAAGAGPSFFSLTPVEALPEGLIEHLSRAYGIRVRACRLLGRSEAVAGLEGERG